MATLRVTNLKNESFAGDQLYLKSDGRLGIGTTTPDSNLDIEGSGSPELRITDTTNTVGAYIQSNDTKAIFGSRTNHPVQIEQNAGAALYIDTLKNVGIGTTSPSKLVEIYKNGLASIKIKGDAAGGLGAELILQNADTAANGYTEIQFQDAGTNVFSKIRGFNLTDGSNNGYLEFFTASATSGLISRLKIADDGKVGIGTTSPSDYLDVVHSANAAAGISIRNTNNSQGSAFAQLYVSGGDNAKGRVKIETNGAFHTIDEDGNGNLIIEDNGTERLRLTSGGKVNIGGDYTNTTSTLRVLGDSVAGSQVYLEKNSGSTNNTYNVALTISSRSTGSAAANYGPAIGFQHAFGASNYAGCLIASQANADTNTADLVFYPRNYGYTERLRIDLNGMSKFTRGSGGTVGHFYANARESNILIQNNARTWKIVNYDYGDNGSDHLGFHDGSADRMIIQNDGSVKVNDGDLIIGTSGHGIDFSATSGTGASELLNDYEHGSWTPTIYGHLGGGSFTISSAEGRYAKVGKLVTLWGIINWTGVSGSGVVNLAGYPFTPHNTSANNTAVYIGARSGWSYPRIAGLMHQSGYINMQFIDGSAPYNSFNISTGALQSSGSLYYGWSYEAA